MRRCPQCGGSGGSLSCEELFDLLLALDHQREPPWGPLHGVVVACYFLQHPSDVLAPAAGGDVHRAIVQLYLAAGLPAVDAFAARVRRLNSHRRSGRPVWPTAPQEQRLPDVPPPTVDPVTIADVAVDGSFPAHGYEERVRAWARSTATM